MHPVQKPMTGSRRAVVRGITIALLVSGLLLPCLAEAVYQQIRVPYPVGRHPSELFFHPDLELMGDDDGALLLLSRPELTAGLRARGFEVEVVVPDLEAFYAARTRDVQDYGIWHTYAETVEEMQLLHSQYPTLTTAPASIATTGEGRTVWAMKISDHPALQEDEPEVLFDGMHHAREIMTVEVILHFMWYLCDNYGTDPVVTFLVDNRQIWFVPLLNVDGFVYNELTNPNGGGMWRKNRRDNGGGCWGVDPNRNYPYEWVGPGSSTDPCSDTYRGPFARSEPEIIGHTAFINGHNFVNWQSYHSVAGMVLIPWAYTSSPTPDDATFQIMGDAMASQNGYDVGQPPELLYLVNGGSIDWGYGATIEHPKIFSFTTEIGGSGFWPNPSERDGLIAENLYSNIYLCQVAGAYLELVSLEVTGGNGNGRLDPGETASIVATIRNPGVIASATNVEVSLSCDDPYLLLSDADAALGTLLPGESASNGGGPFDLTVEASCPQGRSVNLSLTLEADGGLRITETRALTVGQAPVIYENTFETPGTEWAQDPSHDATTGAFVRVDPVGTGYQPEDDTTPPPGVYAWITAQNPGGADGTDDVDAGTSATRSPALDLSSVTHARLDLKYFHGQRDPGDDAGDGFRVSLSNDGGATFPVDLVTVGDVNYAAVWRSVQVDLEDYLPLTSQMMLRVQASDPGGSGGTGDIVEGGVDDVYVLDMGDGNEPPSAPALVSPPDGSTGQPSTPTLTVSNAVDPEGQVLTYGFRVYSDPLLTQPVASVDAVPEGAGGTTSWIVAPDLASGTYYWRAYASDPSVRGLYMETASFTVGASSVPLDVAVRNTLLAGPNPMSEAVRLRYYSPAAPYARLTVHDLTGRRLRTLEGPRWSEGWQEILWDGRDDRGDRLPAGVYWVHLVMPEETRTVRVVRID